MAAGASGAGRRLGTVTSRQTSQVTPRDLHGDVDPPDATPPVVVEFPDGTVCMQVPAVDASVSLARRFSRSRWTDLPDQVLDDLQVIVAELVSNAVRHGRPEIELRLRAEPFAVNVAVLDHNPELPPVSVAAPESVATSGRGLLLVDRLSGRWGIEPFTDHTGKTVWASLST